MDISSLAFRTDLAMLEHSGSLVEDRGTHLVVRTPDNPSYWWGNFLLLATAPADTPTRPQAWLATFEAEFPEARHRTFGVDGRDGGRDDLAPFTELGFEPDVSSVMTATAVHEPPRPNTDATYRPLDERRRLAAADRAGPGRRGSREPQSRVRHRPRRGRASPRRRRVRRVVGRVRG